MLRCDEASVANSLKNISSKTQEVVWLPKGQLYTFDNCRLSSHQCENIHFTSKRMIDVKSRKLFGTYHILSRTAQINISIPFSSTFKMKHECLVQYMYCPSYWNAAIYTISFINPVMADANTKLTVLPEQGQTIP